MGSRWFTALGAMLCAGCFAAIIWTWLGAQVVRFDGWFGLGMPSWLAILGVVPASAGLLLVGWRIVDFVGVAFVMLAHGFVIAYEEPVLERRFGHDYAAYRARVNRWLPRAVGLPRSRPSVGT